MQPVARFERFPLKATSFVIAAAFSALFAMPAGAPLVLGPPAECQQEGETVVIDSFGNTTTFQEPQPCPSQTGESARMQSSNFLLQLSDRVSRQHRAGRGVDNPSATAFRGTALGGAAGADYGRWSVFAIGDYAEAERDETTGGRGYEQDASAAVMGGDYRFGDSLIVGATASYLNGDTDFDDETGSQELETFSVGLHGSKYWQSHLFLDWMATYGDIELDIERSDGLNRYEAFTEGRQWSGTLSLGYQHSRRRWRLTPVLKAFHLRGEIDDYRETVTASAPSVIPNPRDVDEQYFESTVAAFSLQTDYIVLLNWGVLIPSIELAYRHEFADADKITGRRTVEGGINPFSERPDDPDDSTATAQLGMSAQFRHGWSVYMAYEHLFEHDFLERRTTLLGVRYEVP